MIEDLLDMELTLENKLLFIAKVKMLSDEQLDGFITLLKKKHLEKTK